MPRAGAQPLMVRCNHVFAARACAHGVSAGVCMGSMTILHRSLAGLRECPDAGPLGCLQPAIARALLPCYRAEEERPSRPFHRRDPWRRLIPLDNQILMCECAA
eukprot:364902-Chlamydomonas_euryale.AAC.10